MGGQITRRAASYVAHVRRGTLVSTLALALVGAPAAHAATASVSSETEEEGTAVSFALTAAPGEANRVTVTAAPPSGRKRTVVFRDAGAPLTAGDGCRAGAGATVVCSAGLGDFANSVDVTSGDGDDSVDASAVGLRGFTVFVDAGSGSDAVRGSRTLRNALFGDFVSAELGDDRLTGGRAADFLQGGRGADVLDGRGGSDEATYRDERHRVIADLAAGFARSAAGERDRLRSIEMVQGGSGADVLRGNGVRNVLFGEAGDDALLGAAGPDRLVGGAGRDRLVGGLGTDLFDGGAGADRLRSADGRAETVNCAAGADRVLADRADRRSGCEAVRLR
jgi:Ca2+-binding RTX toxin-like protein